MTPSLLTPVARKHLEELNYPAPKTVSKLEDQVCLPARHQDRQLSDLCPLGFPVLIEGYAEYCRYNSIIDLDASD